MLLERGKKLFLAYVGYETILAWTAWGKPRNT
jgi:hypothetical protein